VSAPVDVLAAMRHAGSSLHGFADEQADPTQTRLRADNLIEARAAVAELIEASKVMDARYRNGGTTPEWTADLTRWRAAIARIGGQP
jgi:hypothetical protein